MKMQVTTNEKKTKNFEASPWIIVLAASILFIIVAVQAIQNINRNKQYMSKVLHEKGAALIRSFEAGARTGIVGMNWKGPQAQNLLIETANRMDILYLMVTDKDGMILAHNNQEGIGQKYTGFTSTLEIDPDGKESWRLTENEKKEKAFEVYSYFRPLRGADCRLMRIHMGFKRRGKDGSIKEWGKNHWCFNKKPDSKESIIFVGLDITPFEEARKRDINNIILISLILLVLGAGGFISLFWLYRYRTARNSLQAEFIRNEQLTGLAAGVAHEIRNPLSSIKGIASYFGTKYASQKEDREAAEVLVKETDRLNRVIGELLGFARPTQLKIKPIDIDEMLEYSIRLINEDAKARGVTIKFYRAESKHNHTADRDRLYQCLLNIYINAISAMKKGGELIIRNKTDEKAIKIQITDSGEGIKPDDIEKVFDPYFTTKPEGSGLGLAIAQKIIEAHKGRIKIESSPGKGTKVAIVIPGS